MASGDTLFVLQPNNSEPPGSSYATLDTMADASTPTRVLRVLDFDGAADEHADWVMVVPSQYDGGGFTWSYRYAMAGTDGDIVEIELRCIVLADASSVLTADLGMDTATASTLTDDPSATANEYNDTGTGTLSHANAGSPSVGDVVLIRATRDISVATNADDLQLIAIEIVET